MEIQFRIAPKGDLWLREAGFQQRILRAQPYLSEDLVMGEDLNGSLVPFRGQRGSIGTGFSHGLEASPAWDNPPCLVLDDDFKINRVGKGGVPLLSEVTCEISAEVQCEEMCQQ